MSATAELRVERLGGDFAAAVSGVDLRNLTNAQFESIKQIYTDAEVVFFLDQQLTPDDHLAFAERWGEVNVNRFFANVDGHPKVAQVLKEPDQQLNIGGGWHTDHSYDQIPALGSMLYALELPETGGDTLFASMTAAFAALSSGMQEILKGMRAVHSSRHVFGEQADREFGSQGRIGNAALAKQDAVHPVVVEHPLSKRPALYVNPGFTLHFEGWSKEESESLLSYLYRHAAKPEFTYRHHWQEGTLAFWDNRALWHYALNDYQGQRRLMHRVTLEGVPLNAATAGSGA